MSDSRKSGVLAAWRLSRSGGYGRVWSDGKSYFTCKALVIEGLPVVGCAVTFNVAPAKPGTLFAQAINVKINNTKIVRALDLPVVASSAASDSALNPRPKIRLS